VATQFVGGKHGLDIAALTLGLLLMMPAARAEDAVTVNISLRDHRFSPPSCLRRPVNQL
jgi:uncharacterized membrane protein